MELAGGMTHTEKRRASVDENPSAAGRYQLDYPIFGVQITRLFGPSAPDATRSEPAPTMSMASAMQAAVTSMRASSLPARPMPATTTPGRLAAVGKQHGYFIPADASIPPADPLYAGHYGPPTRSHQTDPPVADADALLDHLIAQLSADGYQTAVRPTAERRLASY